MNKRKLKQIHKFGNKRNWEMDVHSANTWRTWHLWNKLPGKWMSIYGRTYRRLKPLALSEANL